MNTKKKGRAPPAVHLDETLIFLDSYPLFSGGTPHAPRKKEKEHHSPRYDQR
jgi:hypothetical protein